MNSTILIIEDVELNRVLLKQMFEQEYQIVEKENGKLGIEYLKEHLEEIAIVLLDVKMPVMDGYQVMEYMKKNGWMTHIPVILITDDEEGNAMERGYGLGATDVIFKPFRRHIVIQRVNNVIELYRHKNHLEEMVKRQTEELSRQYEKLREHHEHLIEVMHDIIEYRHTEASKHIKYVQGYTSILLHHFACLYPKSKMTEEKINMIVQATQMHDVGKITLPDSLISRQGRLSDFEMDMLKEHTTKGERIMQVMTEFEREEYQEICRNVCLYHHEKYDGRGYPFGLKKDRIPIEAQIVALADMYDALVNSPARKEIETKEEAYSMLLSGSCGVLSPKMKACLESAKEELEAYVVA